MLSNDNFFLPKGFIFCPKKKLTECKYENINFYFKKSEKNNSS